MLQTYDSKSFLSKAIAEALPWCIMSYNDRMQLSRKPNRNFHTGTTMDKKKNETTTRDILTMGSAMYKCKNIQKGNKRHRV